MVERYRKATSMSEAASDYWLGGDEVKVEIDICHWIIKIVFMMTLWHFGKGVWQLHKILRRVIWALCLVSCIVTQNERQNFFLIIDMDHCLHGYSHQYLLPIN